MSSHTRSFGLFQILRRALPAGHAAALGALLLLAGCGGGGGGGSGSGSSSSGGTPPPPPATLNAPTAVSAEATGQTSTRVSWTAPSSSLTLKYSVQRCTGSGCTDYAVVGQAAASPFEDSGLAPATSYRYQVSATDSAGTVSAESAAVAVTTQAAPLAGPTAPANLVAHAGNAGIINLAWGPATDTVGITSYRVERCASAGCTNFSAVGSVAATTFTDTNLSDSATYVYRVSATDAGGLEGPYSNAASATTITPAPIVPSAPATLTVTAASPTSATVTWGTSTDTLGITGYVLERCTGSGCTSFAVVTTLNALTYLDTTLAGATSYGYRVKAVDAAGTAGPYAGPVVVTTPSPPPIVPTAPTNVTATVGGPSSISLTWSAAADALGIQNYRIERCAGNACTNFAVAGNVGTTNFGDTGLAASTTYTYRVVAIDTAGTSGPYSTTVTATTAQPPNPPAAPAGLVSAAAALADGTPQVNVFWQPSPTAGTVSYSVERCVGSACSNFAPLATTTATAYVDTGVSAGTTYLYRVRAGDAVNGYSAYTGVANATTYSQTAWAPATVPAGVPGLREADGSLHVMPAPNPNGRMINVVQRAAELGYVIDPTDSANDDRPGIEAVLEDAQTTAGTTVYFPDGTYNLITPWRTNSNANILLTKSQVNLVGQSQAGTILVSSFDDLGSLSLSYTGILVSGAQNVVISSLTVTSTWNRAWPVSTSGNSPSAGGVTYGVVIQAGGSPFSPATNVVVQNVTVSRYHRMGIVAGKGSHDVTIQGCVAMEATDIGDGGTGYGFVTEGPGHVDAASNPNLGIPTSDQYFTLIEGNQAIGPYIRHAVLLQYWSHNNLIVGNSLDDTQLVAISLHGEDEYANEIRTNAITRSMDGLGFGNSGATHDASGPYNWGHDNDLVGTIDDGIFVEYGTPLSTISSNILRGTTAASAVGVLIGLSSNSLLGNNLFSTNSGTGYVAVRLTEDPPMNASPAGGATNWTITGNHVVNSGMAFVDASKGTASGNQIQTTW